MKPITIIIPTYNRLRALEAVWPSYIGQQQVEKIIVVDDGSTDHTARSAERLMKTSNIPVQWIRHSRRRGLQAAKMTALAASETEWVLIGEDDVWLEPRYSLILLQEAEALGADIMAGRLVPVHVPGEFSPALLSDRHDGSSSEGGVWDMDNLHADFSLRVPQPVPAPHLHSVALIKRSVLARIGYDTRLMGSAIFEETDFYLGAAAAGAKLFFTPSTACFHLRGPICSSGGLRVNRLLFEYFALKNALYLTAKHWPWLQSRHGFRGRPASWSAGYMARREWAQLKRIGCGDYRSWFKGK